MATVEDEAEIAAAMCQDDADVLAEMNALLHRQRLLMQVLRDRGRKLDPVWDSEPYSVMKLPTHYTVREERPIVQMKPRGTNPCSELSLGPLIRHTILDPLQEFTWEPHTVEEEKAETERLMLKLDTMLGTFIAGKREQNAAFYISPTVE